MPELVERHDASKVRLYGPKQTLDGLATPADVQSGRVAADEVLWVAAPGRATELVEDARRQLAGAGSKGCAIDHSDGYALFTLRGDDAGEVFARLSSVRLPADGGFVQGQFAQVPGRIFAGADAIDVIVTADVAWFVRERLTHVGAHHGLTIGGAA